MTDKGFEKLLKILKKKLTKDNELPDSTYAAKKVVCPLGLEVQKIHACLMTASSTTCVQGSERMPGMRCVAV